MDGIGCAVLSDPGLGGELAARFERDVVPLRGRLYAGAIRLTRNQQDAEDIVQEAILHAYRGFGTFREGTDLMAWLYRIMHNTWINHCRKKQRRRGEVAVGSITDDQLTAYAARSGNDMRSAEVTALDSMPDSEIRAALMTLREQFRLCVYYADVEGYSYKEIAEIMNTPVGTVVSRLNRGRQRLRTNLLSVACQRGFATPARAAR
jgi:RNA polymerase sigma-70 factor, ECF subfamily